MATVVRGYEPQPMFDRRLGLTYSAIGVGLVFSLVFVAAMGFTITPAAMAVFWSWPFLAISGMLARRIGFSKSAAAIEGTALLYGQGLGILLLLYPLAALSGPYADPLLAKWDEALGFDWLAYQAWCEPYLHPLAIAYKSFRWQPLLLVAALVLSGRIDRLWTLTASAAIAGLITAAIFPFFPGEGVFIHYGATSDVLKNSGTWTFTSTMEYIRGGGRVIDPSIFTGLVSFPSYHAAEAIQFAWAGWAVRWLRWPLVILNVAVLAATPIIGAHYLVDVIAGVAVGAAAIVLAKLWQIKSPHPQQHGRRGFTSRHRPETT